MPPLILALTAILLHSAQHQRPRTYPTVHASLSCAILFRVYEIELCVCTNAKHDSLSRSMEYNSFWTTLVLSRAFTEETVSVASPATHSSLAATTVSTGMRHPAKYITKANLTDNWLKHNHFGGPSICICLQGKRGQLCHP